MEIMTSYRASVYASLLLAQFAQSILVLYASRSLAASLDRADPLADLSVRNQDRYGTRIRWSFMS